MPKNKQKGYLSEYAYIKTNKKNKTSVKKLPHKLFLISITLIALFILVFFANIFAGLITPGRINLNRGDRYLQERNVYAVELANFDNIGQANEASLTYKQQLAAGYVINDKGTYRVLASLYQSRVNAESVIQNLKESEVDASLFNIKLPVLYMDLNLAAEQKESLKKSLELWYDTYVNIYNISLALDKSEKTIAQCEIELLNLKTACEIKINDFYEKVSEPKNTQVIYTKIYLNMLQDRLSELIGTDTTSTLYSSKLKEGYFRIIYDYLGLLTELAKN
ncbi:MAG: hypothetical protein CVV59_00335 [Tenericutes bacterium HGW-Tenericutes-4]|jgi:hypothetical protein|nr:MAG: hypothetical protein CVV59_00335 [Tenericutes bacterium HGW-Tenericutes-4]